jgi:hypothetical protein
MRASVVAYWATKEGNSAEEYEDAWRVLPGVSDEVTGDRIAVAVADGATESSLARQWATVVTHEFAEVPAATHDVYLFAETALNLSARWPSVVESYVLERERDGRPLRWYERSGIEKGAFSTLLALQVSADRVYPDDASTEAVHSPLRAVGHWSSAALGDTCLFHIRDGKLRLAFPLDESADFGTSPPLLCSLDPDGGAIADHVRLSGGVVGEGDDFFVCTDALAAWFLARAEEGGRPWDTLRDLTDAGFAELVYRARRTDSLRNDDITLVHVDIW